MVTAKIDADAVLLKDLFTKFYVIPDFQREYVWKKKQVNQLLEDLYRQFMTGGPDEYFLGSLVLHQEAEGYHVVDGQQRITTLYILIAALRDHFKELDPAAQTLPLDNAIRDAFVGKGGEVDFRYRVTPQYSELATVMKAIGDEAGRHLTVPDSKSPGYNLVRAYEYCDSFLKNRFGEDLDAIRKFFGFMWDSVELISIETQDMKTAFTIFETINDRGVGLDALDLLKNLLFRETNREERSELNALWREMLKALREGGETRPIRFLRYYLVANYDWPKMLTASQLFAWISEEENKKLLGYGKKPVRFMDDLLDGSIAYANFNRGLNPDGSENQYLRGILYQKTGVRQHLPLLMAARNAPKGVFEKELSRWIENMVFVYALTGVQWNSVESLLPDWTRALRAAKTGEEVREFVHAQLKPAVQARAELVWDALYETRRVSPRLLKYLLAGITQYVEEETGKGGSFDKYFIDKLSIEHILPQQNNTPDWRADWGATPDSQDRVYWLGNLTLLHWGQNSSCGNGSYAQKLAVYETSSFDLTRSLAVDLRYGKGGGRTTTAVERLGLLPVREWNPAALERRHQMMMQIVSEVWGVPLPTGSLRPVPANDFGDNREDLSG